MQSDASLDQPPAAMSPWAPSPLPHFHPSTHHVHSYHTNSEPAYSSTHLHHTLITTTCDHAHTSIPASSIATATATAASPQTPLASMFPSLPPATHRRLSVDAMPDITLPPLQHAHREQGRSSSGSRHADRDATDGDASAVVAASSSGSLPSAASPSRSCSISPRPASHKEATPVQDISASTTIIDSIVEAQTTGTPRVECQPPTVSEWRGHGSSLHASSRDTTVWDSCKLTLSVS